MKGFYHVDLGYWETITDPSEEILEGYPDGTVEITMRPTPLHTYDGSKWLAPTQIEIDEEEGYQVRLIRNLRLNNEVDPIVSNALRWAELTEDKQSEWRQYRTDLLNLSDQSGFPHNVIWPTKPE
jgi:hypothetical protein